MKKQEYLDDVCKCCCGRNTCCVGTDHFCPCRTYIYCNECWDESATEQSKIDIDKACEVYRKELKEIIDTFNTLGKQLYNINDLGELIHLEGSVKDFRKIMEE